MDCKQQCDILRQQLLACMNIGNPLHRLDLRAWSDGTVRRHETTFVAVCRAFVERFDT
jgi:hypothetical protein